MKKTTQLFFAELIFSFQENARNTAKRSVYAIVVNEVAFIQRRIAQYERE